MPFENKGPSAGDYIGFAEVYQKSKQLSADLRKLASLAHPRAKSHFDNAADMADRITSKLDWVQSVYIGDDS